MDFFFFSKEELKRVLDKKYGETFEGKLLCKLHIPVIKVLLVDLSHVFVIGANGLWPFLRRSTQLEVIRGIYIKKVSEI